MLRNVSEHLLGVPRESRGIKAKQKENTLHWFSRSGQWRVFFLRIGLRSQGGVTYPHRAVYFWKGVDHD